MRWLAILYFACFAFLASASDAQAAPVFLAIGSALSGAAAAFGATAFGTFLTTATGKLLTSVALSALRAATAKTPRTPGITTEVTATGGTNAAGFILGLSATAGDAVCPPMSHGLAGKVPNAYLTYVIALGDVPGQTLTRVAIDGAWEALGAVPDPAMPDYGLPATGRCAGYAWFKYYDGSQAVADPMLLAQYGTYPERPWLADMVGTGVPYVICTFRYNRELYQSFPTVLFESGGIKLYDPRKDSTIGGSGAHRWGQPATYEPSRNNVTMIYNIKRGITLPGLGVWGGQIDGADMPTSNWFAAMNLCDVSIGTPAAPTYQAGIEVRVDMEPASVIEELLKGCAGQIAEVGGDFKIRVGGPGLPVMFLTDDDIIVTRSQDYDPFPTTDKRRNGIDAKYPDPEAIWKTKSAPSRYNPAWETEDGGRRMASLDLPACPFPLQVQRLTAAYIADDRRFRAHAKVLGPEAAVLEPLDVYSWTSAKNGYDAKLFDISQVVDDQLTILQRISSREVDASDYSWSPSQVLPYSNPSSNQVQTLSYAPVVTAAPHTFFDNAGNPRRPGVRINWPGLDQDGVRAVMWEVYLAGGVLVARGTTNDVEAGFVNVGEGILPATNYQVRVRFVSDRPMGWSGLINVTSPNVGLTVADLDAGVAPAVPTGLALSSALSGAGTVLTATWTAVVGGNIRYDVRIRQGAGNDVPRVAPTNRFTWETLPNTAYTVAVRAVNALGVASVYSAEVVHTTVRDTVPPAVPAGLTVAPGFETLWLKWTPNTEADLAGYELFESATATPAPTAGSAATYTVPANTVAISGLADNVTRHFWLRAVDTSGNTSAWSARVQGTTVALNAADISAIVTQASYAAGLVPPVVVASLPATGNFEGRMAFLTTDDKLYRHLGTPTGVTGWTRSVDGNDLVANSVTAGSIVAGAIGADQIAAGAVLASKLAVGDFTNLILNSDLINDDGWTFDSGVTLDTASSNMTKPGMLRIDNATSSGRWGRFTTDVDAGQQYHMSCEIRCATGPDVFSPRLSVDWLDRTGAIISANGNTPTVYDITTPAAVAAVFTAPALAVKAVWRFGRFDATGTTDIGDAFIGSPMVRRRNGGELIVEGSITADKVTTGEFVTLTAQVKDAIITNAKIVDLSAAKLLAGTALAGSLTVSGKALSVIKGEAEDPAAVINAASTQIDPGKVVISGGTTLADWRRGGDQTHIDGGMLSANTVSTEKLTVGNRMITVTGVTFEHNDPGVNQVSWTAGTIRYINDAGIVTGTAVSAGSATYTTSRRYIYWAKGASALSSTTSTITAFDEDNVILASYGGNKDLVTDYGMTIIDGSNLKTGTVTASRMNVTELSAITADVGTLTAGVLQSPGFTSGAATGARLNLTAGTAEFNGVILSRQLQIASGSFTYTSALGATPVKLRRINTGIRIGDNDVWTNSKVALVAVARMLPASVSPGTPGENALWSVECGLPYNAFKWTGRSAWISGYSFNEAWTVDPGTLVNPSWATGTGQRVLFDVEISQVNFTTLNAPITIFWKIFQVT